MFKGRVPTLIATTSEVARVSCDKCSCCLLQVRMVEHMDQMDEAEFAAYFSETPRTWTTTLSDGSPVQLRPDLAPDATVSHGDRLEYARLVQQTRLGESNKQVSADGSIGRVRFVHRVRVCPEGGG